MKVLVTGSSGFLGSCLCDYLNKQGADVTGFSRKKYTASYNVEYGELLGSSTALKNAMRDVDVVVHCAARAHITGDNEFDQLEEYRLVNVQGSLNVAKAALDSNVRRMIFVSSIKVNGEETQVGQAFNYLSEPAPEDSYGLSKWEAEQALWKLVKNTSLELVVLRPPLLYGAGVKGNLQAISKLLKKPLLLPLGAIHNKRSFLYIGNLIDVIVKCFVSPAAVNKTFLVSDDNDISTSELFRRLKHNVCGKAVLLPVNPKLLKLLFRLLGKRSIERKLLGNLQVDCSFTKQHLSWQPSYTVERAMERERLIGEEVD